nr:YjcZ family sporulation protein [Metabacillus niabensis]
MYGYENSPHMAGANAPHVAGANIPHQPVMPSYVAPAYGYCAPSYGNTFALIVVLFILLIIIGATIYGNKC